MTFFREIIAGHAPDLSWLTLAPLLALLAAAIVWDFRQRRIPNWLVLVILLSGIGYSFVPGGVGIAGSLLGVLVGFAILFPLFVIRAFGAGDVKLLAAIGAWMGPWLTLWIALGAGIIGGVLAIAMALAQGRLTRLLASTHLAATDLMNVRATGVEALAESNAKSMSQRFTLPYAVPLALASVAVIALIQGGRP